MALAVLLLAGLVIFTGTGVIVWVAYLLVARAGRFLHRRMLTRRSV